MVEITRQGRQALALWAREFGLHTSYLAVDVESDGLDTKNNRPVHIAWCTVEDGKSVKSEGVVIDWTRSMSDADVSKLSRNLDLVRVNMARRGQTYRWTVDELKRYGVHPQEAADRVAESVTDRAMVAHHGWGFDYPMIGNFLGAHGHRFSPSVEQMMDTCLMARALFGPCPPRVGEDYVDYVRRLSAVRCRKHTLGECISLFDLDRFGADQKHGHSADYDNWVCHLLFEALRGVIAEGGKS